MIEPHDRAAAHIQAVSLRQLQFFAQVADLGSFSRAAERMAVSQPALSAAIRQVEERLDLRLFDRTTHRVVLTDAGRALLPHAQRLLITARNAFADMHAAATRERTTVRVGVMPSAVAMVAQAVARLAPTMPELNVNLRDGRSDELLGSLRQGAYDLAVCVPSGIDADLTATLLVEDEMLLVLPSAHPLAAPSSQPWSALRGSEIVHFTGGSIGKLAAAALHDNGLTHSSRYRVDQVESLYGLVHSGLALGIMPRLYTHGAQQHGFTLVPLVRPTVTRKVMLVHRPELADEHRPAARFGERLAAVIRVPS